MKNRDERLALLKSVSLFSGTPEVILAEAAEMLEELRYLPGETIFCKGDLGEAMFIIAEGKVRVHDGELTFNYLEKADVFGEMAALDPEPRSASITALEETCLYRLERRALFDLIEKRSEVTRGIIHILCQRLRDRVRDMAIDFEYMQQFAKVTAAAMAVEAGNYTETDLDDVAQRSDELGHLAHIFQRMVREVYIREQQLKQQVVELRIEIDEVKKSRQVAEITETDYFKNLRQKAQSLRSGGNLRNK